MPPKLKEVPCPKCGEQRVEMFSIDRAAKDGLQKTCRGCQKAYRNGPRRQEILDRHKARRNGPRRQEILDQQKARFHGPKHQEILDAQKARFQGPKHQEILGQQKARHFGPKHQEILDAGKRRGKKNYDAARIEALALLGGICAVCGCGESRGDGVPFKILHFHHRQMMADFRFVKHFKITLHLRAGLDYIPKVKKNPHGLTVREEIEQFCILLCKGHHDALHRQVAKDRRETRAITKLIKEGREATAAKVSA